MKKLKFFFKTRYSEENFAFARVANQGCTKCVFKEAIKRIYKFERVKSRKSIKSKVRAFHNERGRKVTKNLKNEMKRTGTILFLAKIQGDFSKFSDEISRILPIFFMFRTTLVCNAWGGRRFQMKAKEKQEEKRNYFHFQKKQ